MLSEFTAWLWSLVVSVFSAIWDLLSDMAVSVVDAVVTAFSTLVAAVPVPGFMSGGLQSVFSGMDGGILWVLGQVGLPAALAVIGAGYGFRFLRKVVTLFQW